MTVQDIARVAHQINGSYCAAIGDPSQLSWQDAPQWQKDSAIAGVKFHLDNPNATVMASHESWMEQKRQDGWSYGPLKDVTKKEHPCFMPYEDLPAEQRVKDYLFISVVHSLLPFLTDQTLGSEGMKAIDVDFNSGLQDICELKLAFANAWDRVSAAAKLVLNNPQKADVVGSVRRLESLAKTNIEQAAMWAVKAITR